MKSIFTALLILLFLSPEIFAQDNSIEIYGTIMILAGYNFKTIDPDYYDVLRVTRLPSYNKEFTPDGKIFYSSRQSQIGVKSKTPTSLGDFRTHLY